MNYYAMRREVSVAVDVLIEKRESWPFDKWIVGMVNKYGISQKMAEEMLRLRGFRVENNKVVEIE